MKNTILFFMMVTILAISGWMKLRNSAGLTFQAPVTATVASPPNVVQNEETHTPIQTEIAPTDLPTPGDRQTGAQDVDFQSLVGSSNLAVRLAAARRIAARQDEYAFRILTGELVKAESTGDPASDDLIRELSQTVGQMRGSQIQPIATELAYTASPTVRRVAVDAAVASEPSPNFQTMESGGDVNAARQAEADDQAQTFFDATSPSGDHIEY